MKEKKQQREQETQTSQRRRKKKPGIFSHIAVTGCAAIFLCFWAVVIVVGIKVYTDVSRYFYLEENGGIDVLAREDIIEENVELVIEEGDYISSVASKLEEMGVIDDASAFSKRCNVEDLVIQPGTYALTNKMTFEEITSMLAQSSDVVQNVIVIREGMTQNEIAKMLEEEGIVTAEEFNKACNEGSYDFAFLQDIPIRDSRLEGYLFPDTYNLAVGATAEDVVKKLLVRFNEMFDDNMRSQAQDMGYSVDQIVTIASMIEGEIKYPDERATAASVIYNRLKKGMKLQLDCTVQYALKERTQRVMESDLDIDSLYNTYQVDGLPVGPIGNPGKSCLEAALNPEKTDYIYYVLENMETGQHHFTDNYDDFLDAKAKYQAQLN